MKTSTKITLLSTILLGMQVVASGTITEAAELKSNGLIEFVPLTDPVDPVDPMNPELPVEPVDPTTPDGKPAPGTGGPLSIDFASSLDFGKQKITSKTEVYNAAAQKITGRTPELAPNYVQVSDNRGTLEGWTLTVTQPEQFATDADQELTGAAITFTNAEIATVSESDPAEVSAASFTLIPGAEQPVMSATDGAGSGTHLTRFGTDATAADSISLEVPGSTTKYAAKYMTSLTWTLSEIPANI